MRGVSESRPASKRHNSSVDTESQQTAAKPRTKSSKAGSESPRKQPTNDNSKANDTKHVRKVGGENIASKAAESPRRVVKRSTTDLSASATRSRRNSSEDLTSVRSARRSERPSSRSSSGGRQGVTRKPQQRSATDLTESAQHNETRQQPDEVYSVIMSRFAVFVDRSFVHVSEKILERCNLNKWSQCAAISAPKQISLLLQPLKLFTADVHFA